MILCFATGPTAHAQTVGDLIGTPSKVEASAPESESGEKAREAYARFLERATDSPMRANALRRLADLELEEAIAAVETGAPTDFRTPVARYRELLADYPDHDKRDHALYQLARALDLGGESGPALATLQQLTTQFPTSGLVDEAWFRQGELQFSAKRFADAVDAYSQVYARAGSRFESNARYKHAWGLFRLERYAEAVASFDRLFGVMLEDRDLDALDKALTRGQREMLEDGLRANSLAFVEIGGHEAIDAFLDQRGDAQWSWLLYERLGEHYLREERYADAAESFAAFARRNPVHARAPGLQTRVIQTFDEAGFAGRALQARAAFVDDYRPSAAFWNQRAPGLHADILAQVGEHLDLLTGHYHAQVQAGDTAALAQAERWYRVRIDDFAADTETPGQHFLFAELLFDAGRFADAAREYEYTAYRYDAHERSAEAGYAAILSVDRAIEMAGDDTADLAEFALDNRLRFASAWPGDARAAAVAVNAAEMLFERGDFETAVQIAGDALVRDANLSAEQQRTAWVVQAHSRFELTRFAEAEDAYVNALRLTTDAGVRAELNERLAATIYSQGEAERDAGALAMAATHFQRLAALPTISTIHDTALYDAAAVLTELQRWDDAALALHTLRSAWPASKFAGEVAELLTGLYLDAGQPLNAAAELEGIAAAAGDADKATTARWQAAGLYADNGEDTRYLATLETLAAAGAASFEDRVRAHEKIIAFHADDARQLQHWRERAIALEDGAGELSTDYSRTVAATAALALAEPLSGDFDIVALTLPLEDSLPLKKQRLQNALAAFEKAAAYGVQPVATASTYHIAELYRGFGVALMQSERPAELDELALEEYEFLLEEQAFPFEEQAIEIHTINAGRAADLVFDRWVRLSFERLAELVPARYARSEIDEPLVSDVARD